MGIRQKWSEFSYWSVTPDGLDAVQKAQRRMLQICAGLILVAIIGGLTRHLYPSPTAQLLDLATFGVVAVLVYRSRRRMAAIWQRSGEWARKLKLGWALFGSLIGALAVVVAATLVLGNLLNVANPPASRLDITKVALTVAAGVGGVVALVVAYRRQRDLEDGRFVERFGAAAKQLGDSAVAVRLAGVYAMAGVADESAGSRRQQCIDVLCGYLRLPYDPAFGANHLQKRVETASPASDRLVVDPQETSKTSKYSWVRSFAEWRARREPVPPVTDSTETHYEYRLNDRAVRRTIVDVIASRTRGGGPWSQANFDLRGSVFEDVDFSGAVFSGEEVRFDEVQFIGRVSFTGSEFNCELTSFRGAQFSPSVDFSWAKLTGKEMRFDDAQFRVGPSSTKGVRFRNAVLSSSVVSFRRAVLTGVDFNLAVFGARRFKHSESDGASRGESVGGVSVDSACATTFAGATLYRVNFMTAIFAGKQVLFENANIIACDFRGVIFVSPRVDFVGVDFGGGKTVLTEGPYRSAGPTTFGNAIFGPPVPSRLVILKAPPRGEIDFRHPFGWDPAPRFDWSAGPPPPTVKPRAWPPDPGKNPARITIVSGNDDL